MHKFRFQQPCTACMKGTYEACDTCGKPFDSGCLFKSGAWRTIPPDPADEYPEEGNYPEELCMSCYIEAIGAAPFALWAETNTHTTLAFKLLQKGSIAVAGDVHSWYCPPAAGNMLALRWGGHCIELDTYRVLQLLNFLKAHEPAIRQQAKETADVLIPESHKRTEAAIKADAGIVDYSEYE